MRLDLTDEAFLVFRSASSGEINVVYRRIDGNIGWIDAATPAVGGGRQVRSTGLQSAEAMASGKPSTRNAEGGQTAGGQTVGGQPVAGRAKRSS